MAYSEFFNWAEEKLGEQINVTREAYGDQSTVFKLQVPNRKCFLKIGTGLSKEAERLEWLAKKLPVPKVIGFTCIEDKDALLLSEIEGTNLAKLSKEWSSGMVVGKLAGALRQFHNVDASGCPFGENSPSKVLVHGDACLPNFIFDGDNFSGYVDLGDMRIDDPKVDLAAAVWSLQFNLGPGYGLKFLREYGIKKATAKMVEELRLQYEKMQKEWGL